MLKSPGLKSPLAAIALLGAALATTGCAHQVVQFGDSVVPASDPMVLTRPTAFRIIRDEGTASVSVAPFIFPGLNLNIPARVELHNSEPGIQVDSGMVIVTTAGLRPIVHTTNVTAGAQGTTFALLSLPGLGDIVIVTDHAGPGTAVVVQTLDGTQQVDLTVGPVALYDAANHHLIEISRGTLETTPGVTTLEKAARAFYAQLTR